MLYLFFAAFFWGSTFLVQRTAADLIDPFLFNGVRFFAAGLILILITSYLKLKISLKMLYQGTLCGFLVFLGINFQQIGVSSTTAGKSGIITSLYLLFIPIILLFNGRTIRKSESLLLIVSLSGFYLLSAISSFNFNKGDLIILISALIFAIHTIAIGKFSKTNNPFTFSAVQFLSCGILSLLVATFSNTNALNQIRETSFEIAYACLGSVLIGYTLQVIGQKKTTATKAAFIMSLEGPIAMVLGAFIIGESHTGGQYLGSLLIAASAIAASLLTEDSSNQI